MPFPIRLADRSHISRDAHWCTRCGHRVPPSTRIEGGCQPEAGNALPGFAVPARCGDVARFATPIIRRSWPKRRRGCRTRERPWTARRVWRAGQHILRLRFQVSHASCERATVQIGQQETAQHRKRRQERCEQKCTGTNSKAACVRGDADSPTALHRRIGRDDLLSADRIVSYGRFRQASRSITKLHARQRPWRPGFARDPRDKGAFAIDDSRQPVRREVLALN